MLKSPFLIFQSLTSNKDFKTVNVYKSSQPFSVMHFSIQYFSLTAWPPETLCWPCTASPHSALGLVAIILSCTSWNCFCRRMTRTPRSWCQGGRREGGTGPHKQCGLLLCIEVGIYFCIRYCSTVTIDTTVDL